MSEIDGLRVHGDEDHARHNLDGECGECETNHRILESLPNQPISPESIETIEEKDGIVLSRSIVAIPGDIVGANADMVSEDIVLASEATVRTLTRYGDEGGWVVKQELRVPEDRDARDFAQDVYDQLANEFSHIDEENVEQGDLIQ